MRKSNSFRTADGHGTTTLLAKPLLLTVNPQGFVLPSLELLSALGLKNGCPIELRPPRQRNGGCWYLDTRPEARRRLSLTRHSRARFDCDYVLSPRHFKSAQGQLYTRLALVYNPEQKPTTPGYYELYPSREHSTPIPDAQAPHLPEAPVDTSSREAPL